MLKGLAELRPGSHRMSTRSLKYKAYPSYRPSGVEWLGEIPEHWEVRRLKYLATVNDEALDETTDPDREIAYVDIGNVDPVNGITGREYLSFKDAPSRARRIVRPGDVIVSTVRTYLRAIARIEAEDQDVIVSTGFAVIRPRLMDSAYIAYAFRSPYLVERVVARSTGVGYPAINASDLACLEVAQPSPPEQRAIAAFLERETANIDVLIAKYERLIELQHEKRTALITQCITKGLNSDVATKETGVEWLGRIPAHWYVTRLKRKAKKIGSGKTPKGGAEVYVDDGIKLIRSQNVHFGGLRLDDVAYIDGATDEEMSGSRVVEGDVLLNITGASLGRCCVANLGESAANVNQHVCIIRPDHKRECSSFLAYSVESPAVQYQIFNNENGVSRDALNFEQIGALILATPGMVEQREIVTYLNGEAAKIDALIKKINEAIDRLEELRTALISAAVTGRIDVRGDAD